MKTSASFPALSALWALTALAGCAKHDPCEQESMFGPDKCNSYNMESWNNLVYYNDTAKSMTPLDPNGILSSEGVRLGFFLQRDDPNVDCRPMVSYHWTGLPQEKDTVWMDDIRLEGYPARAGSQYSYNPCYSHLPQESSMWMVRTKIVRFPDAEGSRHGVEEWYRFKLGWNGNSLTGEYHTKYYTEKVL